MHSTILMTGQIYQSRPTNISPPLSLKRAITTTSATDSSTASSVDDAGPENCGKTQRATRQRDKQPRNHVDDSCSTTSSNVKGNRPRRSIPFGVSFGEVEVRTYDRSIGDWWDVQHGLCLGWEYVELPAVPLQEEDESRNKTSKVEKAIGKAKAKFVGLLLVARKKRNSMGMISADAVVEVEQKSSRARIRTKRKGRRRGKAEKADRKLSYEDCKPTAKCREELLKVYGFSSIELDHAEAERKLLRLEYSHWTRTSQNPSKLFVERCLSKSIATGSQ